jgi:hypothetical protein
VRLLLENTWTIDLAKLIHGGAGHEVRVPTPAAFIMHKGLVYRKRTDQLKKEKDLYYIFYVVDTFVEWHDWIRSDLSTLASRWPAWFKRCAANLGGAFADESPRRDDVGCTPVFRAMMSGRDGESGNEAGCCLRVGEEPTQLALAPRRILYTQTESAGGSFQAQTKDQWRWMRRRAILDPDLHPSEDVEGPIVGL